MNIDYIPDGLPPVAELVTAGMSQTEAEAITDSIFRIKDIANLYLINTEAGDVLINAGLMDNIENNKSKLSPHRSGPLKKLIITQAHPDHFGGVPQLKGAETQVVAQKRFTETCDFFEELEPYLKRRMLKLWGMTFDRSDDAPEVPRVIPDIVVDEQFSFVLGGRKFEVLSTPGGETLCSLTVWLPQDRIAFVGNLFGPILSSMPFLTTIRGEKPRLVKPYLQALDRVRKLGAEILIAGHSDPVFGADNVRSILDKMHAAVSYVRNETIKGMNEGKDVHTLMREIQLPEDIRINEFHGTVPWAVRAIWEESSGWFHYDSTTSLYGVPRSSVHGDLAEMAGGSTQLAQRAKQKLDADQPLQAMHLLDIALDAEPNNKDALTIKAQVLENLLAKAGNINVSEVMWLRSELIQAQMSLSNQ